MSIPKLKWSSHGPTDYYTILLKRRVLSELLTHQILWNIVQTSLSGVIVLLRVFLTTSGVGYIDWRFDKLTGSHLQSQVNMTSDKVVEISINVTSNSRSQASSHWLRRSQQIDYRDSWVQNIYICSNSIIETTEQFGFGLRGMLVTILGSKPFYVTQLSRTGTLCRTFRFFFFTWRVKFLPPLRSDSWFLQYDNHGRCYGEI